MNIETFKRFLKPGQVFGFNLWPEKGLYAGRLIAVHDDCIEVADKDGDTSVYPHDVFTAGVRIVFGEGITKNFEAPRGAGLKSLLDSPRDGEGELKPALTPDEITRLIAGANQ